MARAPSLVSCLMVTLPLARRFEAMRRAIDSYLAQTYGQRELVIVHEQVDTPATRAIAEHVAALGRADIRLALAPDGLTLGALRNHARAAASGDIHLQWDDDDLYHPRRIERQLAFLVETGAEAACLQEVMQWIAPERRLYCVNWRGTQAQGLPGSLICRASVPVRYPEAGANARRGEDTKFVCELQRRGAVGFQQREPHLYVYVSHGANTWDDAHHHMLAERLAISSGLVLRREAALREGLALYDFGPGPVLVAGANGPGFALVSA